MTFKQTIFKLVTLNLFINKHFIFVHSVYYTIIVYNILNKCYTEKKNYNFNKKVILYKINKIYYNLDLNEK